ncbi:MAG: HAD hydrolase-like protein [Burkholderiaceae bacterium]|nr:HAD hydrolase-like protein [Burkholderiaceae bacterium]
MADTKCADQVVGNQLAQALDGLEDQIDVLSLDCFDTLIWRATPEPPDVFCELAAPVTRMSRMVAEQTARERRLVRDGLGEVTLDDIYRCALPSADADEIGRRVAHELALEHRHCLPFGPAIALIRRAHALGKRVVVVSDTYLRTEELSSLIAAKVGADVRTMIHRIYCSSAFGQSKSQGLFKQVLADLKLPAARVLHVGDNARADVDGAVAAGIRALLLAQGDRPLVEQWRLELAALLASDTKLRDRAVPLLPHRPLLAARLPQADGPAERLGYGTVGPIMDGFARWVRDEARAIEARGSRVKLCFLMRDGYLPLMSYKAIAQADDPRAHAIELSRFVAFSASFSSQADVDAYLGMMSDTVRLDALARQLMFTSSECAGLLPAPGRAMTVHQFAERVRRPANLRKVIERSAQARERLFTYLRHRIDPQPGETLLLVDVGAAGTVQNRMQSIVETGFGVEVEGRYLLLRDVPRATDRKCGYFGPDRLDGRMLESLYNYIAVIEQLCTVEQGSVVGYDAGGEPQRKAAQFPPRQVTQRRLVQQACLRFIADRADCDMESESTASATAGWHGALAAMGRLLFLPQPGEIAFFEDFAHDMNLGIKETVPMIDHVAAREDLRRIGPLYPRSATRVFTTAELRGGGLDLALLNLARRRLDLDVRPQDFQDAAARVQVMVARGQSASVVEIEALPTHEGFLAAAIPIGRCEYAVGVLFGQQYEWLQLESARVATVKRQFESAYRDQEIDVTAQALLEGCTRHAGGLIQFSGREGFLYFAPPPTGAESNCVLRVVFRPLALRSAAAATGVPASGAAEHAA